MKSLYVWIDYQPGLYQDLFLKYFQYFNRSRSGINLELHSGSIKGHTVEKHPIDIFVLSLDKIEPQNTHIEQYCTSHTKLVAFSPKGNQGWRRITPQTDWEFIRPFGLMRLSYEVLTCSRLSQPGSLPNFSENTV